MYDLVHQPLRVLHPLPDVGGSALDEEQFQQELFVSTVPREQVDFVFAVLDDNRYFFTVYLTLRHALFDLRVDFASCNVNLNAVFVHVDIVKVLCVHSFPSLDGFNGKPYGHQVALERKLISLSHGQELGQLADLASDWLFTLVQPSRSQLAC